MGYIKRHIFLTYGIISLLIYMLLIISDAQYDSGGFGGLLILTFPIWGIIYWAPNEVIFTLNNGTGIKGQIIISILMGLGFCLVADYFLNSIIKKNNDLQINT